VLYSSVISCLPGDVDAAFHRLVRRTKVRIQRQGSLSLFFEAGRDSELIRDPDLRDSQDTLFLADISFHMGHEVFSGRNSTRIQRSAESAGQSAGNPCDNMIKGGGVFLPLDFPPILLLIKIFDAPMDAEMNRFRELLYVGRSVGSLVFVNSNVAGVG
jgi:hypothetical protein